MGSGLSKKEKKRRREAYDKAKGSLKTLNKYITDKGKEEKEKESDVNDAKAEYDEAKTHYTENLQLLEKEEKELWQKYEENQKKIRDVINATNVDEGNIPQFLNLLNDGLVGGTIGDTVNRERLNAKLDGFRALLERATSTKFKLDYIFDGKGLGKCVKYLVAEEYVEMDDVLCDMDDEYTDITDIIDAGLKADGKEPLGTGELRKLNKICKRKGAEATWMKDQLEKGDIVKEVLNDSSPVLADFFGTMNVAVDGARRYLALGLVGYNQQQEEALKSADQIAKKLKAIKAADQVDSKANEQENEQGNRAQDAANRALSQLKGKDEKQESTLAIARGRNNALLNAAIIQLHVVDDFKKANRFQVTTVGDGDDEEKMDLRSALTIANDVETCCLQIFESQAIIRTSVLTAKQLIGFKPMKPSVDAEPLWVAIIEGIAHIIDNYIEMVKVTETYFAYFVKFKSGFEHYLVNHQRKKDKMNLTVALEYIVRDVKDFTKFKDEMQITVDRLTKEAKKVIKDCMSKTAGAEHFVQAANASDDLIKKWQAKNTELQTKRTAERVKRDKIRREWETAQAEVSKIQQEIKHAKETKVRLERDVAHDEKEAREQ